MKTFSSLTVAFVVATALIAPQVFAQLTPTPTVAAPVTKAAPTVAPNGVKLRPPASTLVEKAKLDACGLAPADATVTYDMQPHVASTATAEAQAQLGGTYPAYIAKPSCPMYVVDFKVGTGNGPKLSPTDQTPPKFFIHPEQVVGLLATSATQGIDRWCTVPTAAQTGATSRFVVNIGYYVKQPNAAGFVHLKSNTFRSRVYVGDFPLAPGSEIPSTATCRLVPDAPVEPFSYPATGTTAVYRVAVEALFTQTDWLALATGSYSVMQPTVAASLKPPPGILPPPSRR
jgi:hypothetical protein